MLATTEGYEATFKKFTSVEDKSYNGRKCKRIDLVNSLDPSCIGRVVHAASRETMKFNSPRHCWDLESKSASGEAKVLQMVQARL